MAGVQTSLQAIARPKWIYLNPKPYTAEQALQKGAYAAQARAPAPVAEWLLVRHTRGSSTLGHTRFTGASCHGKAAAETAAPQ